MEKCELAIVKRNSTIFHPHDHAVISLRLDRRSGVCEVTLTSCFVVDHSGEVLDAKLSLIVVLWRDVVRVEFVLKVQLVQHGGVCALQET